jgi:hypothetical protein
MDKLNKCKDLSVLDRAKFKLKGSDELGEEQMP